MGASRSNLAVQQVSPGALVKNPSVLVIAYLIQIVKYKVTEIGNVDRSSISLSNCGLQPTVCQFSAISIDQSKENHYEKVGYCDSR
jgi:hypothetical protein